MDGGYYTAAEAASLTGVPKTTIHYWVRTGLIEPSRSLARPILFSFLDLRDIRVIDRLRKSGAGTRAIRRAVDWLRDVADVQHIVHADCFIRDREVIWVPSGSEEPPVVASQGGQMCFSLDEIYEELDAEVRDGEVVALRPVADVRVDPDVRGGTPVVAGTRIPTSLIAELADGGMSADDIAKLYPSIRPHQVATVVAWEKKRRSAA